MGGEHDRFWPHPPIEFPFFGLASWDGPTWVEFFEGPVGKPVETLWLGHRVPGGRAHLSVGTRGEPVPGPACGEDLAFGALFSLSERMRPDRGAVTFPAGFNTVQLEYVQATAERWRAWARTSCRVDGDTHALAYWRYAWGWAGFVVEAGAGGVTLVGVNLGPENVCLETVQAPSQYGFDPTVPLFGSDLYDRTDLPPEAQLPLPWSNTMHDDHRALIEHHGLDGR